MLNKKLLAIASVVGVVALAGATSAQAHHCHYWRTGHYSYHRVCNTGNIFWGPRHATRWQTDYREGYYPYYRYGTAPAYRYRECSGFGPLYTCHYN